MTNFLLPDEPLRFSAESLDRMLIHCTNLNASDITIQTNSPILAEIYGRLEHATQRKISNTEVGDVLNIIYGCCCIQKGSVFESFDSLDCLLP